MNKCLNPLCSGKGIFEEETGKNCPICTEKFNTSFYHVDGGGFNGNTSCICVYDSETENYLYEEYSENLTNNEAEYKALIKCLKLSEENSIIESDSQLIVNQFNGKYKINHDHLKILCEKARKINQRKNCVVRWIRREKNFAGKFIDNKKNGKRWYYGR